MITFGLTGGIASGKSTVTKTFRAHNIPIVDADIVARQVVMPGSVGLAQIISIFGKEYLLNDGTLDRATFGKLIFSDSVSRSKLDHIMAPLIEMESAAQLKQFHDDGFQIVGYDAALICEMGNAKKYQPLIVVACSKEIQLERLMSRNGLSKEEALDRINSQMSVEEKCSMADYVIDSSSTVENSISQTEKIINSLWLLYYKEKLQSGKISYSQVPWAYRDTMGNEFIEEDNNE